VLCVGVASSANLTGLFLIESMTYRFAESLFFVILPTSFYYLAYLVAVAELAVFCEDDLRDD